MKKNDPTNFILLRLTGLALWASLPSHAQAESRMMPVHETYQSTRSVGMAEASAAVADDENAIFSNPAGIGQEDNPKLILRGFAVPNIGLGTNRTTYRLLDNFGKTQNTGFTSVENLLNPTEDSILFCRGSTFPYITISRFQLGLLIDATAEGYQNIGATTPGAPWDRYLQVWQRSQAGGVAGFSVPWKDTGASVGLTTRYMFRSSYFEEIIITGDNIQRNEKPLNKTRGFAWDLGFQFAPKKSLLPSMSFALRDVGNTRYYGIKDTDSAEIEKANLMMGLLWKTTISRSAGTTLLFTSEAHHINDNRVKTIDRFRLGSELRLGERVTPTPFSLRLGHNLSGFAYGASIDLLLLKAEFGSFVMPLDTAAGRKLDRRNFARLTVDLRN